jgi:hypothetical protein
MPENKRKGGDRSGGQKREKKLMNAREKEVVHSESKDKAKPY